MADAARPTPQAALVPARRSWSLPILRELPKLTDLTLASAIGGGGGTTGGGSTVFGLLLAVGLLASGCSADRSMEPSAPEMPKPIAEITCSGEIATLQISCASPQASPGVEILGGQGFEVALRSSNVAWNGILGVLTFNVSVQNLTTQRIGYTGTTPTSTAVFFVDGPHADVGSVNVDFAFNDGNFTGTNQVYYRYLGALGPMETSAPQQWQFHMNPSAATFNFTVMVAADVFDQGGVLQWTSVAGTTQYWFRDVAASSATDRMAVGTSTITAHYTGGKWVSLPMQFQSGEGFTAVTAVGVGEYLAVTDAGAVLRFKNKAWTLLYRRADNNGFADVWGKDSTKIVAVGFGGTLSRYSGGVWTNEDHAGADFYAVGGSADGTLVSAVTDGGAVVWTSSGAGAFALNPNFSPITGFGKDIVYDASGNVLMAYTDLSGPTTGVIKSSTGGILMSSTMYTPRRLIPHGTNKVAFGGYDAAGGGHRIIDVDYASLPGTLSPLTDVLPSPWTFDLWRITPTNTAISQFSVTTGQGHLLSWNGSTWSDDQGSGDWFDPDLWGIGDTLFAIDGIGDFYKIVNGVKTTLPTVGGLNRLWGSSSTEFWATDHANAWHYEPVGGWQTLPILPGGAGTWDIWADPTGATVIVLQLNGRIDSRIGGVWSQQSIGQSLSAVWGCDAHTAWIVTEEGNIYKWLDGTVTPDQATGGSSLRAIAGNQFCDPWVMGDNGTIWHRLGGAWTSRYDPSVGWWNLRAVAIRGAGQAIAAGEAGYAGLFSDASQVQQTPLPTQGKAITTLWRLSNGEVYAAGDQFLLRGRR